ncbi:unnamed protein product [Phytomonas sp. EM1]|nr:unnamed protein product [Phytomonas sp. EM1]|eukprot:CCW65846.1 unnamed protein product [Phytomonas sp. isolate EM1]
MSQAIISYVLSKLTNIADVRPADVETSLRDCSIALKNVSVCRDTLNSVLPVLAEDCTILSMTVFLPSFTTSESIFAVITQVRLVTKMGLPHLLPERTMEGILGSITNETILGCPKTNLSSEAGNKMLSEDEELLYTENEVAEECTITSSEDAGEYQDLLSCRSDGELLDTESTSLLSFDRRSASDTNVSTRGGFLCFKLCIELTKMDPAVVYPNHYWRLHFLIAL